MENDMNFGNIYVDAEECGFSGLTFNETKVFCKINILQPTIFL